MKVERAGEKPKRPAKKLTTKNKWIILFSTFGVVIVGLVIAIVVVLVTRGLSAAEEAAKQKEAEQAETQEYTPKEKTEGEKIYEEVSTNINSKLDDVYAGDQEEIFSVYEEYINLTTNEEAKALLQLDYYQMVMLYDFNREKGQEVLDNLVKIDDSLKGVNSAATILNAAEYYGDTGLYERYASILIEREKTEGIDLDLETAG
jgi:Na+-transporting methylmalonyl-CoA/oxaloacetate decarboxylase gamma subunit